MNALAAADLTLPPLTDQGPQPGKRAAVTAPEYAGTKVHHLIVLPDDWTPDWQVKGKRWPVIAEYTGNYFPASGSTGEVEGAALGYGLARGRAIWVVLPYVAKDRTKNERTWWGDIDATVGYAKANLPRICAEFGGDPKKVVLCGFSPGAIGVSFLCSVLFLGLAQRTMPSTPAESRAKKGLWTALMVLVLLIAIIWWWFAVGSPEASYALLFGNYAMILTATFLLVLLGYFLSTAFFVKSTMVPSVPLAPLLRGK